MHLYIRLECLVLGEVLVNVDEIPESRGEALVSLNLCKDARTRRYIDVLVNVCRNA